MGATGPQGFGTADFYVAQIPCATARAVIIEHHYSHRVVNNSYLHLGVFREGAFEGVLQWGYALNPARAGKVVYQACSFLYLGFHESPFFELDGEIYHNLLATAKRLGNKRGAYLRANLDRARKIMLRQYRYIRFLKTDWIKRLRMPILPYPKRQPD